MYIIVEAKFKIINLFPCVKNIRKTPGHVTAHTMKININKYNTALSKFRLKPEH